jgi:uncharacterized YigZ family protein
MDDCYKTIEGVSEGVYKEKGSRFLAYAHRIYSEVDVKEIVADYKKRYFDARHHCYAWQIGVDGAQFRSNDDGEPSGTAGKPILGQFKAFGVTNILIVVVRYFGGVKLGTGGLIQAYKSAAADALLNATIMEQTVDGYFTLKFGYEAMNDVMKICKDENLIVTNQQFGLTCELNFNLRQSRVEGVCARFTKVDGVELNLDKTV